MNNIRLNKDICEEYLNVLKVANEQWFYNYAYSTEDYLKLVKAVKYFEDIKTAQRKKLIKEGAL
jgi:hypothetical protein